MVEDVQEELVGKGIRGVIRGISHAARHDRDRSKYPSLFEDIVGVATDEVVAPDQEDVVPSPTTSVMLQ